MLNVIYAASGSWPCIYFPHAHYLPPPQRAEYGHQIRYKLTNFSKRCIHNSHFSSLGVSGQLDASTGSGQSLSGTRECRLISAACATSGSGFKFLCVEIKIRKEKARGEARRHRTALIGPRVCAHPASVLDVFFFFFF